MKFLRIVKLSRWEKHPESDWPEDSGLHSDALCDMRTTKCHLSVYAITDKIDWQRVAVAFAASRDQIAHVDCIMFEDSDLKSLGIAAQQIKGNTPDNDVNDSHYNLVNLTVKRLAQLTEIVYTGEHKRILQRDIKTLLRDAAKNDLLDITKIRSLKIQKQLLSDM